MDNDLLLDDSFGPGRGTGRGLAGLVFCVNDMKWFEECVELCGAARVDCVSSRVIVCRESEICEHELGGGVPIV